MSQLQDASPYGLCSGHVCRLRGQFDVFRMPKTFQTRPKSWEQVTIVTTVFLQYFLFLNYILQVLDRLLCVYGCTYGIA